MQLGSLKPTCPIRWLTRLSGIKSLKNDSHIFDALQTR